MTIDWKPGSAKLRQFGLAGALLLTALAAWVAWKSDVPSGSGRWIWPVIWQSTALLIGACGLVRPMLLKHVFIGLSILAFPIGWTVNLLILGVVYYLVFTPFALVFRVIGRDILNRRSESQSTYWIEKSGARAPSSYYKQF